MANERCQQALKLLARSHNVLITGSPGTGKSKLLAEVADAFETAFGVASDGGKPRFVPNDDVPIPPQPGRGDPAIPAPTKTDRKVFRTVFHQNTKHRDFVSGIMPTINNTAGVPDFAIVKGTLYRASEHAKTSDGAALLIIDEINRGPAVQVFGGSIVAIESDKRLAPGGTRRTETQYFELFDSSGDIIEYALPHDLYILAAMNQADASVEPLDVAFLRRWEPLKLEPDEKALRDFYGLNDADYDVTTPDVVSDVSDLLEASVRAWKSVNEQITLGRGSEFQIGHGVLMSGSWSAGASLDETWDVVCIGWAKILAHIEEVFFGDSRGVAAALNALDGPPYNPFSLREAGFANDIRLNLEGPVNLNKNNIYLILRALADRT